MAHLYIDRESPTAKALYILDAAQKQTVYMGEGFKVLESVRRYLYRTASPSLWRVA